MHYSKALQEAKDVVRVMNWPCAILYQPDRADGGYDVVSQRKDGSWPIYDARHEIKFVEIHRPNESVEIVRGWYRP